VDLFSEWNVLSNEFKKLKEAGDLSGSWSRRRDFESRRAQTQWRLQDASDDIIAEFEKRATEAGELLGGSGSLSYRDTWLEALRLKIRRWERLPDHKPADDHTSFYGEAHHRDRGQVISRLFLGLAGASAKYCNELAKESVETRRASKPPTAEAPESSENLLPQEQRKGAWGELELRFRNLQPQESDGLRAEYRSSGFKKEPRWAKSKWALRNSPSKSAERQFVLAAQRGANLAGYPGTLDAWLDVLKQEEGVFDRAPHSRLYGGDDGQIPRVCEASADYCLSRSNESEQSAKGKPYKTSLGRNIDKYRLECGWSYDDLAHWSNIDKKRILAHVNAGKTAYPSTLKKYADAFTKKLQRPIEVADLMADLKT